jgi:cell division protein FtsQ
VIVKRRRTIGERQPRIIVRRGGARGAGPGDRPPFRWRRWLWPAATACVVVALLGAGLWVWRSPMFEITNIRVEGNERLSPDTIVNRANLFGESMFTADLASAQSRVYGLQLISSVRMERRWPNTIVIVVEERQTWGTWEQDGITYTIDREGFVLGTLPPPPGLPAIRSSAKGALRQGDRVDYQAVDAAAEIYEKLPGQLGTTVSEVAYLEGQGVQVTTGDGRTALLGDSSSIAYKLAVWAALAQEARVRGIEYTSIDLRYGNRPVVREGREP